MKDAYANLLAHLHRVESTAPLEAIRQSLSFHLANATSPGPTSLAATAITSPLFLSGSFNLDRLTAFSLAFRHAVNIKSNAPSLTQWTKFILKGLQGGHLLLRLAAASGLLLGLEDIKVKSNVVTQVQDRLVIDFAQVMDREWESEFYQRTSVLNDSTSAQAAALELPLSKTQTPSQVLPSILISVILISHSLPLIPPQKLQALPLQALSGVLTEGIVGDFIEYLESSHRGYSSNSASRSANVLPPAPAALSSNVLRQHIPTLARLLSLFLSLLLNSKPKEGLVCAQESLNELERIAVRVGLEPGSESEKNEVVERVDVESKEEEESKIKTLLFTHVMLADSILSACLYISPSSYLTAHRTPASTTSASPASLSLTTLQTLSHLSRVVSEFGGISSMNTPSEEGGEFKELKRTAYLALDILAHASSNRADSENDTAPTSTLAEQFVDELCFSLPSSSILNVTTCASSNLITVLSKTSFALSCIEQLVPVLSMSCLGGSVWRAVEPYLYLDPATRNEQGGINASDAYRHHLDQLKRETFESAHSVVLAMFAANANDNGNGNDAVPKPSSRAAKTPSRDRNSGSGSNEVFLNLAAFCERLVPFYAKCLIENSFHGKLSTTQLRIAYPALVRSASTSSNASDSDPESPSQFVLAWYCIDELLGAICNTNANTNTNSDLGSDRKQEREKEREQEQEHQHRLHLTLISCVSALPLPLLARVLEDVGRILQARNQDQTRPNEPQETHTAPDQNERHRVELIQALYHQVLEVVGDREKEYVLRWWSAFAQAANSNEAEIAKPPLGSLTARL